MPDKPTIKRNFSHCPTCGSAGLSGIDNRYICNNSGCQQEFFLNVAASTGALIIHQGELLLIRRAKDPGKGKLCFPGGFVDAFETLEESTIREVREETGLESHSLQYICSDSNEYCYDEIYYHTSDAFFSAQVDNRDTARCRTEVESIEWRDPNSLTPDEFAFPSHTRTLAAWLAGKISLIKN